MFVRFGSWVFYLGSQGFYLERLCYRRCFVGILSLKRMSRLDGKKKGS